METSDFHVKCLRFQLSRQDSMELDRLSRMRPERDRGHPHTRLVSAVASYAYGLFDSNWISPSSSERCHQRLRNADTGSPCRLPPLDEVTRPLLSKYHASSWICAVIVEILWFTPERSSRHETVAAPVPL
jgi:hypothetical protein